MSKVKAVNSIDHFAAAFINRFCCGYRPSEAVAGALGPERR
jgi:hypothetical protein